MTEYRIMTLNMLTDTLYSYGDSRFSRRIHAINEMIKTNSPDLIGIQEMTENMLPYMDTIFEDYAMIGEKRHSRFLNEYSSILYKKDRFILLKQNTFWLSQTPDQKGSKFFFSQFPRITTFAVFKDDKNNQAFSFFNTHLDHIFTFVRNTQAQVLRNLIMKHSEGVFTAVTGDFNAVPDSEPLRIVCSTGLKDTSDISLGSTLRGPIGSRVNGNKPIDHILLSDHINKYTLTKLDQKYSNIWPGDHYPLMIAFEL